MQSCTEIGNAPFVDCYLLVNFELKVKKPVKAQLSIRIAVYLNRLVIKPQLKNSQSDRRKSGKAFRLFDCILC